LNVFKLDAVVALAAGCLVCYVFFLQKLQSILDTLPKVQVNTVIPDYQYLRRCRLRDGVAATAGFKVVTAWLLTLPMHPIISLSIGHEYHGGNYGSASGGLDYSGNIIGKVPGFRPQPRALFTVLLPCPQGVLTPCPTTASSITFFGRSRIDSYEFL